MGSFRPVTGNRHLHRYYNFTGLVEETVFNSLDHSCRSELTRQGISLPQDRYSYGRRLLGLQSGALHCCGHPSLTFQHRAGIRLYTSSYDFAGPCVFVKQLVEPFYCDHPKMVRFIPKLQRQFAQFLLHGSPERLRILFSTTCVGLRYGPLQPHLRGFSRRFDQGHYQRRRSFAVLSGSPSRADLPTQNITTPFNVNIRCHAVLSLPRHPIGTKAGTGILTSLPSASPFGFA